MLLPSTGFTCATFCSKDGTLTSGTRITVPLMVFGSSCWMSRSTAMIEAYSVPWAPETTASTGPGFVPLTTATGIDRAGSDPAGTSMAPRPMAPRAAVAVPTRTDESWARSEAATKSAVSMREFYSTRTHPANLSASVDIQQEARYFPVGIQQGNGAEVGGWRLEVGGWGGDGGHGGRWSMVDGRWSMSACAELKETAGVGRTFRSAGLIAES